MKEQAVAIVTVRYEKCYAAGQELARNLLLKGGNGIVYPSVRFGEGGICVMRFADKVISRIFAAIETLEDFPLAGRKGRVSGTREVVISDTPYLVAHRLYDDDIQNLAVLHGARRWPKNFNMPR